MDKNPHENPKHLPHESGPSNRGAEAVPSHVYDKEFYLTNCADYDLFKSTGGLHMSERLGGPFRMAGVRPGQKILDVGCGRGEVLVQIARAGADAYGIDYSEDSVAMCLETRERLKEHLRGEYHVQRMDAKQLQFPDAFFDMVFMVDIIEHLHDWELEKILGEVVRVLKPSGKLVAHTAPNRWFLDIGYPYYTRWINWMARGVVRRVVGDDDLENKVPTRRDLRSDYERVMHINEQTFPQLARMMKRFFPRVTMAPLFNTHADNVAFRLYDLVARGYPISRVWPLHLIFADAFYAVGQKQ